MVYKPDRVFDRSLKELDDRLEARWNSRSERWEIWVKLRLPGLYAGMTEGDGFRGGYHRIMTVKNPDGSFRPLDNRTIALLIYGDLQADGPDKFAAKIDGFNSEVEAALERDVTSKAYGFARDELAPRLKKNEGRYNWYNPKRSKKNRGIWSMNPAWSNEVWNPV